MRNRIRSRFVLAATVLLTAAVGAAPLLAQFPGVTLPPVGDNQKSVTTQYMGKVAVTLTYNSPDVHSPTGEDRTGKIWGGLVPWGMVNLGFGTATESPWRGGANENTTFEVSHDVTVEGQPLAAGRYGLHLIPGETEWTVVFSKNSTSWGSFFYDPAEDALRVTVKPEKSAYREWLSYEFIDRQWDTTLVALEWENLRVPFRVRIPDPVGFYVAELKKELRSSPGFSWQGWNAAANFLVNRDTEGKHLEQALEWAEAAIAAPFGGEANFTTLGTKAQVLERLGRADEAKAALSTALEHPATTVFQIHGLGRQLLAQGKTDRALEVFQVNHRRFAGAWPTEVGLARGYAAVGNNAEALVHAKKALAQAPDEVNKKSLTQMVEKLEKGEKVN